MTTFAVTYRYRDDSDAERHTHRPAHVEFLQDLHSDGYLYMSGPLASEPSRALLVFEDTDADTLETRLDGDPFFENGLIAERTVTAWNVFFDPRRTTER
ncbi:YciI family protein [Microbacterium proteolyticum]|uniref:YciI family protein n=1 Tax=Microbacterium proteolyticum TaxID=1572644 RepID=UPI002417E763|nr:YciI family protein [Microbacterium proteolyticum]